MPASQPNSQQIPRPPLVTDSLTFCHRQKHLRVNAFVVMPTHLHRIVFDADFDSKRLLPTLADFRKFTGRQLSDYCRDHLPGCFPKTLREQATADRKRRFWQPSRHPEAIQIQPKSSVLMWHVHVSLEVGGGAREAASDVDALLGEARRERHSQ